MTALTTGKDPTLNGTNTDSQPGILTFQTICTALGQKDIYTTVKARIDKELAAAKTEKEAEAKATPVEKKETVETSQANPNTKKNNTFGS